MKIFDTACGTLLVITFIYALSVSFLHALAWLVALCWFIVAMGERYCE